MYDNPQIPPKAGLNGLITHWRQDFSAAISVSLVALPLGLGIALASGVPAMAGIIPAVIGGILTTFIRTSHVAINGPGAGLIVVIIAGMQMLKDDQCSGFPYVLAAIVIAGSIQMLMGVFRYGKLGDMLPTSVIHGMLAAIGVIIVVKQIPVLLGTDTVTFSALDAILKIPQSMMALNPLVTLIAAVSLIILIVYPNADNKMLHALPAPLWVLIVAVILVLTFNTFEGIEFSFTDRTMAIGSNFLIDIPENIRDSIILPNFSKITSPEFWLTVIAITLVASVETLISIKAVDKLDYYRRNSDLNKDIFAMGLSTVASGFIGGLPVMTVIVRSSVNINHGAKTKWSNFYHGALLLSFILVFPFLIELIPKACLAAILVYTGYKLASPRVFKDALHKGWEQLLILTTTLIATLAFDLLWGIVMGIVVTLAIHLLKSQLNVSTFFRHLVNPHIQSIREREDQSYIEVKGIANFFIVTKLMDVLKTIPRNNHVIVDLARAKLVDCTILDCIYDYKERHYPDSGNFEIVGLDIHKTSSSHPHALHILEKPMQKRLTGRQADIFQFARSNGFTYKPEINWEFHYLSHFPFFEHKNIEYSRNVIKGYYDHLNVFWEICDITYDEGALMAADVHHVTAQVLFLPVKIPAFVITREDIGIMKGGSLHKGYGLDKLRELVGKYLLKSSREVTVQHIFTHELVQFLIKFDQYNIECNGEALLVYKRPRLASAQEIIKLTQNSEQLCEVLPTRQKVPVSSG